METHGSDQGHFDRFETESESNDVPRAQLQPVGQRFVAAAIAVVLLLGFMFVLCRARTTDPSTLPSSSQPFDEVQSSLLALIKAINDGRTNVTRAGDRSPGPEPPHKQTVSSRQLPQYFRYVRECQTSRTAGCVPLPCNVGDKDLGVTQSQYLKWERACVLRFVPDGISARSGSARGPLCGSDLATVAQRSLPRIIKQYHQWTAQRAATIVLELWGGGGGGAGSHQIDQGRASAAKAWICGGGGGAGMFVKAVVDVYPGHTYRIEVGGGGSGSNAGQRAEAGFSSRLLEMVPGKAWRVLVEAGGGRGAGPVDPDLLYSPGGRGAMWAVGQNTMVIPGGDGQSSRAQLLEPHDILEPRNLVQPKVDIFRYRPPEAGWMRQSDPNDGGYWLKPSVRIPCDGSPNTDPNSAGIPGWPCYRKPDYFLTCDKVLPMNCFGAAQGNFDARITTRKYPYLVKAEPVGGLAASGPSGLAQGAGHGGDGSCPLYNQDGDPAPRNARGRNGNPGLAVIHSCANQCSFVLALQQCAPAASEAWTLHGLWPAGVANCPSAAFDLRNISELESELATKWPSCNRPNHELWKHEWEKHGSCTGMPQLEYFKQSLQLLNRLSGQCTGTVGDCHLCLNAQMSVSDDV